MTRLLFILVFSLQAVVLFAQELPPQQPTNSSIHPAIVSELIRLNQSLDALNQRLAKQENLSREQEKEIIKLRGALALTDLKAEKGDELLALRIKSGDELTLAQARIIVLETQIKAQKDLIALLQSGALSKVVAEQVVQKEPAVTKAPLANESRAQIASSTIVPQDREAFEKSVQRNINSVIQLNVIISGWEDEYRRLGYDLSGIPDNENARWTKIMGNLRNAHEKWQKFLPQFLASPEVEDVIRRKRIMVEELRPLFEVRWGVTSNTFVPVLAAPVFSSQPAVRVIDTGVPAQSSYSENYIYTQ